MGAKLAEFYKEAEKIGSIKARMRLAILTKISSTQADTVPDSPENMKVFQDAMAKLKMEFK